MFFVGIKLFIYKKNGMKEIWKDIDGFEGIYQISNYGRLKALSKQLKGRNSYRNVKEKVLKPAIGTCGYYQYPLSHNSKKKTILIHREVAKAFVDNPNELYEVNHKDENRLNNHFENLEWCDRSYNNSYNDRTKRAAETQRNTHPSRKAVEQIDKNGNIVATYQSEREAERISGIIHNNICECIKGKRKSAGGYFWRLVSN